MSVTLNPYQIGDITIDTPLLLAPMAGQTNHAFRTLCREFGDCGLVCTEVISSNPIYDPGGYKNTLRMFDWDADLEAPFAVQLFGHNPTRMRDAAQLVVEHGAHLVDVNMGCWVPKVAKRGAGAALMRDVDTATTVVKAVVDAVDVPVTVKIRNGWRPDNPTCVPFAIAAEGVGVQAIAVHARFANQRHDGDADWDWIRKVKEAVSIPVIGNGDVVDTASAVHMLERTGCDGVMIGRGALGKPWLFRQIAHEIRTGEPLPDPAPHEIAATAIKQARRTVETSNFPVRKVLLELRGQLLKYIQGLPHEAAVKQGIVTSQTLEDIENAFAPVLAAAPVN